MTIEFTGRIFWVNNNVNYSPKKVAQNEVTFTKIENIKLENDFIEFYIPEINGLESAYPLTLVRDNIGNIFKEIKTNFDISCELLNCQNGNKSILYGTWKETGDPHTYTWWAIIERSAL
jgi:hypothetical protein